MSSQRLHVYGKLEDVAMGVVPEADDEPSLSHRDVAFERLLQDDQKPGRLCVQSPLARLEVRCGQLAQSAKHGDQQ